MSLKHGNKHYFQLLLDTAKFKLLEKCAEERGVRVSALARDAVYEWLSMNVDPDLFHEANLIDDANWKQSVKNRVNAKLKKKSSSEWSEQQINS